MKRQLIRFACKACGARLAVPVSMGGRSDRCPKCKEVITAPLESEDAAPPHAEEKVPAAPEPRVETPSSESEPPPPQETQPDLFQGQGLRRSLLDDFLSAPVEDEPPSGEAPALPAEEPEPPRQEIAPPEPEEPSVEEETPEPAPITPVNEVAEPLPSSPLPIPEETTPEEPLEMEQLTAPAWKPPMTEQEEEAHHVMGMGHVLEDHSSSKTLPTMRHGVAALGVGLMHLNDLPGRRGRRRLWIWAAAGICMIFLVDAFIVAHLSEIKQWWYREPAPAKASAVSPPAAPPKTTAESPKEEAKPKSPEIAEKKQEIAAADVTAKLPPAPSDDSITKHEEKEKPEPDKKEPAELVTKKEPETPSPPPSPLPPLPEPAALPKIESIPVKTSEPPAPAPLPEPKIEAKPEAKPEPPPVPAALPNPEPPAPAPAPVVAENSTKPEPVPTPPVPPAPPVSSSPSATTAPTDGASSLTTAPPTISLPGVNGAPPTLLILPPPPPPTRAKAEEPAPLPESPAPAKTELPVSPPPPPPLIMAKQDSMVSLLPPPSSASAAPPSPPSLGKLTGDKPPAPLPENKPEEGLPPKVTESGITSAARPALDSLEKFLYASNWQERLKYCQKKESVRSEMEKHYRNHPDGPVAVSQIALVERYTSAKGGVPYCEFELRGGVLKQPVRVYVDEPVKGPPRVDWGAFAEFKDRLLWEFMEKPGAPAQKFRVVLLRKHYFDKDVPDMENKDSFAIVQPGIDLEGHVFATHDSASARQLQQQLGWGSNMPMVLELVWRKEGAHRWVEIASVVEYGWKS